MSASSAKYAVFLTAIGSSGSWITARKLSSPTHVGAATRFVCCNDITTDLTIGYQENAPNTSSSGSRKTSVERPPPRTHVNGERRSRYRFASAAPSTWISLLVVVAVIESQTWWTAGQAPPSTLLPPSSP